MSATIIDGKATAAEVRAEVAAAVENFKAKHGVTPGLRVIIVGDNPASRSYVRNKSRMADEAGMVSELIELPDTVDTARLVAEVERLNGDPGTHGILVQLPLPDHIDEPAVLDAIKPEKDVDGFHPINVGSLFSALRGIPDDLLVPCTPYGCMRLIKKGRGTDDLSGLSAVVVGRSNIVGKPMAALLLGANCTVTIAHSRTHDLPGVCCQADILIAAVGRPQMVKGEWVKPGATVIDVGINRVDKPEGGTRLVGDVDFDGVREVAGAVTPVPGGVGPMTVACLLRNTLIAARNQV